MIPIDVWDIDPLSIDLLLLTLSVTALAKCECLCNIDSIQKVQCGNL